MGARTPQDRTPYYTISVAAELSGMHPQTLRQYDRMGLVVPKRTAGRGRRYSTYDITVLRQISQLSSEGVSLAGIQRILLLESRVQELEKNLEDSTRQLMILLQESHRRVFAADIEGDVISLQQGKRPPANSQKLARGAVVLWRPHQRKKVE